MEVVPSAVGESDGVVVLWEDNPEIGVAWPLPVQMIDEIKCGIGVLDGRQCLILYMFARNQSIDLYLDRELPTTPTEHVDLWALISNRDPEVLKVRYGNTPSDRDREVTFLLPTGEGSGVADKLRELVVQARENGNANETESTVYESVVRDLARHLDKSLRDNT